MSFSSPASLLDVDLQPGKPPVLRTGAADAPSWAAEHRGALRALMTEHGSVLIRGLGLGDAAQAGGVFQRLATSLMPEKEAFSARPPYADRLFYTSALPPNPHSDIHQQLAHD